jgi:hypothetical protein
MLADSERQYDVLEMLDVPEAVGEALVGRLGQDLVHLSALPRRLLREGLEPRVLGREERASCRNGPGESDGHVVHRGTHNVQVVRPRVGDDAHRRLDDHVLAEPLKVRPDGHALEDERLRTLAPGAPHDAQLFADVRWTGP